MPTAEGLRSRKRRLRKSAIEEAALRLFEGQGFEATTVDQIAGAADVSPRTFFHHFASKEDVVLGDFEARFERLIELLCSRIGQDHPSAAIRRALLEVAEDYETEREQILLRTKLMLASPAVHARSLEMQARWEDKVATTFAARFGVDTDSDPRPRIFAAVTLGAMRIAQRRWVEGDNDVRLPELITETLDLLDAGTANLDY